MATRAYEGGVAPLPVPLDVLLATLPSLPRPVLSRLTARMIERLDELDGDPDFEEDNEDRALDEAEPDFRRKRRWRRNESGPGCPISDPDYAVDDTACDGECVL